MSTPVDKTADTSSSSQHQEVSKDSEVSFEDQVNKALAEFSEEGEFSEKTPEAVIYAATVNKRFKDTQASYTKAQQELAALKAEKTELLSQVQSSVDLGLTPTQEEELEELKFSDPDRWRQSMNTYETEAQNKRMAEINKRLKEVSGEGSKIAEIELRKQVLADFQAKNSDFRIDDTVIENDIPPRITRKLEEGKITFESFLQECHSYLKKGKRVASEPLTKEPDLGQAGGGDVPIKANKRELSYEEEIY